MILQGQAGAIPSSKQESGNPNVAQGLLTEMLVSELNPAFYTLLKNGLVYFSALSAANPTAFTGGAAGAPLGSTPGQLGKRHRRPPGQDRHPHHRHSRRHARFQLVPGQQCVAHGHCYSTEKQLLGRPVRIGRLAISQHCYDRLHRHRARRPHRISRRQPGDHADRNCPLHVRKHCRHDCLCPGKPHRNRSVIFAHCGFNRLQRDLGRVASLRRKTR